jgi:hypothetical protein
MTMRHLAAVAVLASMAIHLVLWLQGMRDVHVIGPAFLVNVVAGIIIAVLLVRWQHWLPGVLSACFGMATLGAFTLAATIGLFGTHEHWAGFYVWGAAISEVIAILAGCAVVLEDPDTEPRERGGRRRAGVPQSAGSSSAGPAA